MPLEIADFGLDAAMAYGDVRTGVEQKGTPIGPLDMVYIVTACLALGAPQQCVAPGEFRPQGTMAHARNALRLTMAYRLL